MACQMSKLSNQMTLLMTSQPSQPNQVSQDYVSTSAQPESFVENHNTSNGNACSSLPTQHNSRGEHCSRNPLKISHRVIDQSTTTQTSLSEAQCRPRHAAHGPNCFETKITGPDSSANILLNTQLPHNNNNPYHSPFRSRSRQNISMPVFKGNPTNSWHRRFKDR